MYVIVNDNENLVPYLHVRRGRCRPLFVDVDCVDHVIAAWSVSSPRNTAVRAGGGAHYVYFIQCGNVRCLVTYVSCLVQ